MFSPVIGSRVIGVGGVASSSPSQQATSLVWYGDRTLRLTRGNGSRVLIVMKSGAAVDATPSDNNSYTAADFGSGSQIGTGNYVVFNGVVSSGTNIIIGGLTYGVSYGCRAFEYNGLAGTESYNVDTATGNPITAAMPSVEHWYLYHDQALTVRKDFDTHNVNRSETQNYPICQFETSTHFFVTSVNEGVDGQDRTIRKRKSKTDGLPITQGWEYDTPDAIGDPPSIIDGVNRNYAAWSSGTTYNIGDTVRHNVSSIYESLSNGNIGNTPSAQSLFWDLQTPVWDQYQCWAMGAIHMGGNNWRLYYSGNAGSAQRYSVGFMESSDNGETWTRYASNPVILQGSGKAYYYFHPMKDGSNWYAFAQNYYSSQLEENHLYIGEIHTSSDGLTWTKISTSDIFANRGFYGAIDVSQPWKDGSRYYAYISYNKRNTDGSFVGHVDGQITTYPVGDTIALISWSDWADFADDFIIEREIFRTSNWVDIDARTWCAPMTHNTSYKFVWQMSFWWRCQTLLVGTGKNEPFNSGKILSTQQINDQGYQFFATERGYEAFPAFVHRLILPHRPWLDDTQGGSPVQPYEVITASTPTIVGTPTIARLRAINSNNAGFITIPAVTYSNYLAVKIAIDKNALTSTYGICGMDTDVNGGTRGWRIMKTGTYTLTFIVYGSNSTRKEYRLAYNTLVGINDSSQFLNVGFVFRNGSFKICLDVLTDCEAQDASKVTKTQDDSFTTIQQTTEPLRIGAVYPTTNDPLYAQGAVGACLVMVGDTHATESNWLNNDLV